MSSSKTAINLQDVFLNQVKKEQVPVTIYLFKGIPLTGLVKGFDNYTVVLEVEENKQQMLIFKSAISSIIPKKSIIFTQSDKNERKEN
ncbi:RNA chaperone Hfq [Thermoanaerobacter kivui]|uniref:RNA-binding protein Hfq n=1 Tax=Thermoanaerobacter kivui TaxID=2325 RepID=A0A097AR18_THEKI|nr:RNA chaperone Hfq [Thermoanaerobacter kivui]AIS52238.1 RNA chaperone Hfq [Thermoanaerobacter kivui]